MARLANLFEDDEEHDRPRVTTPHLGRVNSGSLSPSPAASFSSDKENQQSARNAAAPNGKYRAMPPPQLPTPDQPTPRVHRKRKLGERDAPNATQTAHQKKLDNVSDLACYDPEQSIEERRAIRKDFRDLSKDLTDSSAEYLAAGSDGLLNTLERANKLFKSVKQTSDATLDSRLLVSTADLSAKRTTLLNLGDATTGIDVDDFVGKCITFMRRGPRDGVSLTQRRRPQDDSDEEGNEGFDEGDSFNWEWLGRQVCFRNNVRPPVPGFLLGPLSVQKRARKATQRRERLQRLDPSNAVRPEELKVRDLEKAENTNLTTHCKRIRELLVKTQNEGEGLVEQEDTEGKSEDEIRKLMWKHGIANDLGVPFFHFVVNPRSFGQTVENIFYVSFLIRDGAAGIGSDHSGLPTLHATDSRKSGEMQAQGVEKHQAVFHLDFETFEEIIEAYGIKKSIIPHRQPDPSVQATASGWYG